LQLFKLVLVDGGKIELEALLSAILTRKLLLLLQFLVHLALLTLETLSSLLLFFFTRN